MIPVVEIRGDFQVTIYADHEIWALSYTDGTFAPTFTVEPDNDRFPTCKVCARQWHPQERGIRFDPTDGKMICPDCRAKAEEICPDCECPILWSDISGWVCQCDPSDMVG